MSRRVTWLIRRTGPRARQPGWRGEVSRAESSRVHGDRPLHPELSPVGLAQSVWRRDGLIWHLKDVSHLPLPVCLSWAHARRGAGVLARGLEEGRMSEPGGRTAAEAARRAYDLLLAAGASPSHSAEKSGR